MKFSVNKLKPVFVGLLLLMALVSIALVPVLASSSSTENVSYYPTCDSAQTDFAAALDSLGLDSTRVNRALIAKANRIDDYTGTDAQDAMLLRLLMDGKLVQSMPDPVETTTEPTTQTTTAPTRTLEYYNDYETVTYLYNKGSCPSMQGLAVGSTYLYTIKIDSDTNDNAFISMTHKDTGDTTTLINAATGGYYFDYLGHANDMEVWGIGGYSNIFVTTTNKGSESIVRLRREGSYLYKCATYRLTYNGSEISATALAITSVSNNTINFLIKNARNVYSGSVSVDATSADIALTKVCSFNVSQAYINGTLTDLSSYVNQGFDYYDGKMFIPLSGDSSNLNRSVVLVYDISNASGTVYPDQYISFRITSSAYSALFEIESCAICGSDGKLYFNTNRRVTDSDTNHDGIHYFADYTYSDFTEGS